MKTQADIFYSLPEVWDFCLEKIYDKKQYVEGLVELFKKQGVTKNFLILDAGCGSGYPAIDLVERGYHVVGTDKSSEMVRQIKLNAHKRGVSIEAYNIMWSNLAKHFDESFDLVLCRGNSLIYAASWEQNWIVPSRSLEEIKKAIDNFYAVLKPGGEVYIDITNKNEKPHSADLGVVQTKQGPIAIEWTIKHDLKNKIRIWTITLNLESTGVKKVYPSYSYLLPHSELINILKEAGFQKIDRYVSVKGEKNYNVFLAAK